tara:strand:- start:93 stop:434 length:342 start_codon:yes stop_codon:yes gene_type:complete
MVHVFPVLYRLFHTTTPQTNIFIYNLTYAYLLPIISNQLSEVNAMNYTITKTKRPNGSVITLSAYEDLEKNTITYIVKSSNSFDVRFYDNYTDSVDRYNEVVTQENTKQKESK